MKNIVLIYDDTTKVNDRIKTIIGNKSFGEIILKRKKMYSIVEELINKSKTNIKFKKINKIEEFNEIEAYPKETVFFHMLSNAGIIDEKEFIIILEKLEYIKETMVIRCNDKTIGAIYANKDMYIEGLREYKRVKNLNFLKNNAIETNIFIDLANYNNLLMYISSGFDARYFNSMHGDSYTVTKKSKDKKKMKMEYSYYWLLPERMKYWMVMPYDFKEDEEWASYTMERMPMTDLAVRWTHEAVDIEEFKKIMDKIFYFLKTRDEKQISKEEYVKCAEKLYINKLDERIEILKKSEKYGQIKHLIENGTEYNSIDEIVKKYKNIYNKETEKIYKNNKFKSVIGHGDVFFANMLYSKEVNLLRLIDPKGALEEKELWTDPYYDVAKISHSVCGNYDFFNTGLYDIILNKQMKFELKVYFDNDKYKKIFIEYLQNNGFNYRLVRIYEASLFLSMLPLHIDNEHKVLGFILNAINILKEIEKE